MSAYFQKETLLNITIMNLRILSYVLALISFCCSSVFAQDYNLGELSFNSAEQLFLGYSHELLAAKRMIESAQADAVTAGQSPNPTLSLGLSNFNLNRNQGNTNPNNSNSIADQTLNNTVQINQLFERGDKRALRAASAENGIKASKYDFKDVLRQQKLALANAYYDLMLTQESEKIQANNVDLYEKTLEAAELRFKTGDIAFSDVARIRVDMLRGKNDLRQSIANHQKAQSNLAYLIGREKEAVSIVASDNWPNSIIYLDSIDTSSTDTLNPDSKLDQRPDVLAADARIQQAEQSRRFANALQTRDVDIGLQYQRFPGQEPGVGINTLGLTLTIPLFINYQYQGEIARAEVDYSAALEAKEQTRATAVSEITRAHADLNASLEKVQRFDEQMLTEAQKSANATEFAYQHGAIGVNDLLDSRRVLRALQLDAVSAHADFAKSLAAWQASTNIEKSP